MDSSRNATFESPTVALDPKWLPAGPSSASNTCGLIQGPQYNMNVPSSKNMYTYVANST